MRMLINFYNDRYFIKIQKFRFYLFRKIILFLFISSFSINAQTIKVLNIPSSYGNRLKYNSNYFTLEADYLKYASSKLLNKSNFGPSGIVKNDINITSDFSNINTILNVNQLNPYDIIFIGSVFENLGSFSQSEIDILNAWSAQEKKVLIIAEQPVGSPISNAMGFPILDSNQDPTTPTIEDSNRNINLFSGPFGDAVKITQAGWSQGYFTASCIAPALARNANGNATILYNTTYNDILLADTGFFWDIQLNENDLIVNDSEKVWGNLWAWAIREVLTGTTPITGNSKGQTKLISSSPTCEGSPISILVSNALGSVIHWETSIDNGITWNQISLTTNPLVYNNVRNGQTFRAATATDPKCDSYLSTETTVNVVAVPKASQVPDIYLCDDSTNDGIETFNLIIQNATILNSQSASEFTVRYYRDKNRIDEITNSDLTNFRNTSNPQEIFTKVENNTTLCTNNSISFKLHVNGFPTANQPSNMQDCVVTSSKDFGVFDLTSQSATVFGSNSDIDFNVRYFRDSNRLNEITDGDLKKFKNTTNPQKIFVRMENATTFCKNDNLNFDLVVNLLPEINIETQYVICLDSKNNIINPTNTTFLNNPPIRTSLSKIDYSFKWYTGVEAIKENLILSETSNLFIPEKPGEYTLEVENNSTQCNSQSTTKVIGSYPPQSIVMEHKSELFSENNIIEVKVTGNGNYNFKLNNEKWQESNIFDNVTGCDNTIYVRDIFNCNEIVDSLVIVDYPRFFTPNSDGYNDTWNISCKSGLQNAKLFIFDRYGKLLKQKDIDDLGWDGTYNGIPMPADDYWFMVKYNNSKFFKAHFSLKR